MLKNGRTARTILRAVAIAGVSLALAGCGNPPAKRAEPRLGPAPRPRSLEPVASTQPMDVAAPTSVAPASKEPVAIFDESEIGEAVGLPVVSVRPAGALFTATTRMADPHQRPRASLQIFARRDDGPYLSPPDLSPPERERFSGPGNLTTGIVVRPTKPVYTFIFVIRTTATPPIRLSEAGTRTLLEWLDAIGSTSDAPTCEIGDRSFTASMSARDRITCTWRANRVVFDRAALADQIRRAFATVEEWTHG